MTAFLVCVQVELTCEDFGTQSASVVDNCGACTGGY